MKKFLLLSLVTCFLTSLAYAGSTPAQRAILCSAVSHELAESEADVGIDEDSCLSDTTISATTKLMNGSTRISGVVKFNNEGVPSKKVSVTVSKVKWN